MKVHLMYPDRDFAVQAGIAPNAQALVEDLGLEALFGAMAGEDAFSLDVVRTGILSSAAGDVAAISHRQEVLKDCLANPAAVKELFACASEGIRGVRHQEPFRSYMRSPNAVLHTSLRIIRALSATLRQLRRIAQAQQGNFRSEGFRNLFSAIERELDEEFFEELRRHEDDLEFRGGVLLSASLGAGNKGTGHILRALAAQRGGWMQRLFGRRPEGYSFTVAERDESGHRALSTLRDRGVNLVANALAQSNDHMLGFLAALQAELAFYIGCLRLGERLSASSVPTCLPVLAPTGERRHAFSGLHDVSLSLQMGKGTVANDVDAGDRLALVITGANRGGKSTFLRSVGQAQLMMQAGMFVAARSFSANVAQGVFTHFKREEDASMRSGKLDEELARMREIAERLTPDALLLMNESFSSTSEREGSEIARQIVSALAERKVKVFFVTHLYEFASRWDEAGREDSLFLRAQRLADGTRTFKIMPGGPLSTSFGEDLYKSVFGD